MAGKAEDCHKKKDFCKSRDKKYESDIQNVMHTLVSAKSIYLSLKRTNKHKVK